MVLSVTTGSIQPILHVQAPWPTLIGPRAKVYKVPCYAQAKAIRWWQARSDVPMPLSIDEFFDFNLADNLRQPVCITVKEGGEWPELIRCHFEHEPEIIT